MDGLLRHAEEVEFVETSCVYRPAIERLNTLTSFLGCRETWAGERVSSACGAEIVLCGHASELVQRQLRQRCVDTQVAFIHTMHECSPLPTNRAVANANMVDLGIDFESDQSTMTGTRVGLLHS